MSASGLDTCGCCGTVDAQDPPAPRAGLSAVPYRSGTQASALRRMVARLATAVPELTARTPDDPAIALLDAWATVADVVTFYQERIFAEGFLRTATERRSVLELARAIGYELRPGVAASTDLAYTVESVPGAPPSAVVPSGTPVRSVPAQGREPQVFESDAELTALAELNAMRLASRQPQRVAEGATCIHLVGVTTGLRVGDAVLIIRPDPAGDHREFRVLRSVDPRPASTPGEPSLTTICWDDGLGVGPLVLGDEVGLHALRLRATLFGHHAPDWLILPDDVRQRYVDAAADPAKKTSADYENWPGFGLAARTDTIDLDGAFTPVGKGSWFVLTASGDVEVVDTIRTAEITGAASFGITGTVTRITLDDTHDLTDVKDRRQVVVYTQADRLHLADEPLPELVAGTELDLERRSEALEPGATVIVSATTDQDAPFVQRASVSGTTVSLDPPAPALVRSSVRVHGNVVRATHGETVEDEVLGSGDGTLTHQRFALRKPPLTYVPAKTASGAVSTLEVWVDEVRWTEVSSLFLAGPHDRVFVVRIDDDARATVIFGDGERGARLPTGQENVRARYRTGIGPGGDVPAESLSLLTQRPLGIASVANPIRAAGGVAPETLDDARVNAPLTVLTLDRVVSLRDHEDFARAFTGIAKARAVALPAGGRRIVHLTVAAAGGAAVDPVTRQNLRDAIVDLGGDAETLRIDSQEPITFRVDGALLTDPGRDRAAVEQEVTEALVSAFAADRRSFAQPVTTAEVVATVQAVPGVVAATMTGLQKANESPREVLIAQDTRWAAEGDQIIPAELLVLAATGIDLGVMAP